MKIKHIFENIKYLIGKDWLLKIILLSGIISLCGVYSYKSLGFNSSNFRPNVIDGLIDIASNRMFPIVLFFLLLLFSAMHIYTNFEKNTIYIMRFNTKREYLQNLVKTILIANSIVFIAILLTTTFVFIVFIGPIIKISFNNFYNTYNIVYLLYFLIKIFLLSQILSILSVILCKIINKKIVLFLNILFYSISLGMYYVIGSISSIKQMKWDITSYLSMIKYDSFDLEITIAIIYILIWIIICSIVFEIGYRNIKDIDDV